MLRSLIFTVPEFIAPVFAKTSPKRSFSMTENEHFGLVFAKTVSINSGWGGGGRFQMLIANKLDPWLSKIYREKSWAWTELTISFFYDSNCSISDKIDAGEQNRWSAVLYFKLIGPRRRRTVSSDCMVLMVNIYHKLVFPSLIVAFFSLKGTQDREFFCLRFWILCYFIVSYAQILRFCKTHFFDQATIGGDTLRLRGINVDILAQDFHVKPSLPLENILLANI